jgi:PAS domain S-box-containing protein
MYANLPSILVIDDDLHLLATLSDTLKMKGYEVTGVQTGREALAQLEEHIFDVALIDLRLDDVTGLDVLAGIKARAPETECILLTGHASQDSAIQAIHMNAFGYFQKPFDMDQVLLSVQRALEKREAARALRESHERYQAVIHSATDAIISADSMGNIIGWNPGAERMFGYSDAEALNQPLLMIMPVRHQERHLTGMSRVLTGGEKHIIGATVEMEGVRKDGSEFPLELSLAELRVSREKVFTAIIRDATERKWAEGMRRKHSRILGKRVSELNCLYSISELVRRSDLSQSAILQESVYLLAQAYQFPEITACRLTLNEKVYSTDNFAITEWMQRCAVMAHGRQAGMIEICYLEEKPQEAEGPFLEEERKVLDTVAEVLGRFIEQK